MRFVTFGNETINLDNVTHITVDMWEAHDGTRVPFIRFCFATGDDEVKFSMLTWDKKPVIGYHQAKEWLDSLQEDHAEKAISYSEDSTA